MVTDLNYDLELDKAIAFIKKNDIKSVCVQLPDGLKPLADQICDTLENECDCSVFIWGSTCFGACDLPIGLDKLDISLLIQFGHAPWKF